MHGPPGRRREPGTTNPAGQEEHPAPTVLSLAWSTVEHRHRPAAVRAWGDGEIGDWAPAEPGGEPVFWMPTSLPVEREAELVRLMEPAWEACGALVRRLVAALEAIPETARVAVRAALAGETATALAEDDEAPAPVWSVPQK